MPYLMGGFPTLPDSVRIGKACVAGGADLLELGVPYSDPLADGPVIHEAGTKALAAGASLRRRAGGGAHALAAGTGGVDVLRQHGPCPRRGAVRASGSRETGAAGLIVPDLPYEEAGEVLAACDEHGLALVPLVAPTTPPQRLAAIGARARGFLYTVSVVGTTGERAALSDRFAEIVAHAKAATEVPVALGFGISTPEQAAQAAQRRGGRGDRRHAAGARGRRVARTRPAPSARWWRNSPRRCYRMPANGTGTDSDGGPGRLGRALGARRQGL